MLAVELFLFGLALGPGPTNREAYSWILPVLFLAGIGVFVADLFAMVWAGWWASVVSKNASAAVSSTYVRLMILPWLFVAVGVVLSYLFLEDGAHTTVALMMWVGASLWLDWFFARHARRKLFSELRGAAVERYSGGHPSMIWWRRLGRRVAGWRTGPKASPQRASPL